MIRIRVPGHLQYRDVVIKTVAAACKLVGNAPSKTGELRVTDMNAFELVNSFDTEVVSAFSEVFNNICLHSYSNRGGAGEIAIEIETAGRGLRIRMLDEGKPFNLADVPAPDLDSMPEGGVGVFIIRSCVDEFEYTPGPPNQWILKKARPADDPQHSVAGEGE